jgi:hypothetical protein
VDPARAAVGDRVELHGAGWCCPGDDGTVTEQGTGDEWAGATVDRTGALAAAAVVGDLVPGQVDLEVCVRDRCRTATLTVLDGPITRVPSRVTVPTTTPSSVTSGTDPATPGTGGSPGGSGGSGSTSATVPGRPDPSVPTRPVTGHRDLPPLAALVALLAATTATTAALVLVARRLGLHPRRPDHRSRARHRPHRSTRPRVAVVPGTPTFATVGRDGPAPSISIALDLDAGATTLHEVTP